MKKILTLLAIIALPVFIFGQSNESFVPLIKKDGKLFTGKASFKFAIIADSTTIWSNDGSSFSGSEPVAGIALDVKDGKFSVEIGMETMKPFYYELLKFYSKPFLRTWINTDGVYQLFSDFAFTSDFKNSVFAYNDSLQQAPLIADNINNNKEETGKGKKRKSDLEKNGEGADEILGILKERYDQRADANGKIPYNALMKAKKKMDLMPQTKDAGLWSWTWLGPGNIGGRIRAICIHPTNSNKIWIGSASGGIWVTTNGGSSWSPVNDFMANLAITSIVIDPNNYSILYASTGEGFGNADGLPGAGIFKSTDGGVTWNQLASTANSDFIYVNRLSHHPDSTGVVYAVTASPNRVWKSKNGGTTWVNKKSTSSEATDIKVNENVPSRILVGCQNDAYLSTDYGVTFTELSTGAANKLPSAPSRCEVSFCKSNNSRMYISVGRDSGEVWRSDDIGVIWTRMNNGYNYLGGQAWYDNTIWVDPTNSSRIVVGGIDLWRSTDGGTTLTRISDWHDYHNNSSANSAHADQHIIINDPGYNGSTNKIVYFGNDGGIQKATDVLTVSQNSGWTNLVNTTLGITQFYSAAAAADGSIIVGGTQDNDKLRYKSSGTWSGASNWYQANTGDGAYSAVDFTNSNNVYGSYVFLSIKKSTNGGDSYSGAISGLTDAGDKNKAKFIAPFSMDPNNAQRLIGGGTSIWRTTNGASSWSSIYAPVTGSPKCTAIDIAKSNSDVIWVGYEDGHVAKTTNGTSGTPTWTRQDNNDVGLPNRYVTDIAISPANSNHVFVTFSGYNLDNVWYTDDGGAHWYQRTGTAPYDLPALQVNSIRFHPANSNWIYIGTDLGIFSSEDKGQKWNVTPRYSNNNELPVNVEVHELTWQGNEYLIAATFGRGMYRCRPLDVIYVDKNVAISGDGSQANPYKTVTEAVNAAGNGTTIYIMGQTYDEAPILFKKRGKVFMTNGSPSSVIIK